VISVVCSAGERLRLAVSTVLYGTPARQLRDGARRLSACYRRPRAGALPVHPAPQVGAGHAAAYVAARLPATFSASVHACQAGAALAPEFAPRSQLDLGAGTGGAAWAASAIWPGIAEVRLVDRDLDMLHFGRRLRAADPHPGGASWTWQHADLTRPALWARLEAHDLVTAAYALGELSLAQALAVARAAWDLTRGLLVVVEPGTPSGFALVRALRGALVEEGAALLAPCPHARACPMSGPDWCHFAARVQRSALHRQVKDAQLGHEDEKFSYLVFARVPAPPAPARVIRHPGRSPRRIELLACTAAGLQRVQVTRSHPRYQAARKLTWGSPLPPELLQIFG
jgi:ribosomal protein RSM22 (predicted rRNA methylase)